MMYSERRRKIRMPYIFIGKLTAIIVVMVALFLLVLLVLPERTAAAGNATTSTYNITSIQIESGDTLWTLAEEYYTEEFSSVPEYVAEIKRMNGLSTDTLYAGSYLLIPHYITH